MAFIPTLTILAALKARLESLVSSGSTALFEKVAYYHTPNLGAALMDLRIFKTRVCLIVPGGDTYRHNQQGRHLQTIITREVHLCMADRDFGNEQSAQTGSATHLGVIAMNEIVVNSIHGDNLELVGTRFKCRDSIPFQFRDVGQAELPGRQVWQLNLDIEAGELVTAVSRIQPASAD
jgi:hypothetical protein